MADYDYKLPGQCYVKQIQCNQQGIHLKPKLLAPNGFTENQTATLLITKGHILISMDPQKQNIMQAIQELQLRQDETNQDFEAAIHKLVTGLLT